MGSTKCQGVALPETGSQRSVTENSITRTSAKKKFGSACPATAIASATRSIQLFGFSAAATPSGTATTSARRRATRSPSTSVTGSLSSTSARHAALEVVRGAEIATQHAPDPAEVLHDDRPIEPVQRPHGGDVLVARTLPRRSPWRCRQTGGQGESSGSTPPTATATASASRLRMKDVMREVASPSLPGHLPEAGHLVRVGFEHEVGRGHVVGRERPERDTRKRAQR